MLVVAFCLFWLAIDLLKIQKLKMSFNEMKLQVESTRADWEEDLRRLGRYLVLNYIQHFNIYLLHL